MRIHTGFTSCLLKHIDTCSPFSWRQKMWICEHVRRKSEKSLGKSLTTPHSSDIDKNISSVLHKVNKAESRGRVSDVSVDDAALSTYIQENVSESQASSSRDIIPGKGMPPEPPVDCCMSGCANCVWIMYANELKQYYEKDGTERAKKEIEKIENPSLKMFLKLELGLL